jgi:hypothetical protein
MSRNYYGANFSIYLYFGFAGLLPEHHLYRAVFFMFFICLWEEISRFWTTVCVVKRFLIWNSVECMFLPVFHHLSPTFSIAETIHGMHVGIFFTC